MSMLDGVSQCWWLSKSCAVNWNAWAAIGTVAAVFAAIFGPSLQRMLIRRKANALFAFAFRGDVITVLVKLASIRDQFPIEKGHGAAWAAQELLRKDESARTDFMARARSLDVLTKRDLDMSKWPAVDLDLAAKLARAMESVRHFQMGAEVLATPEGDRDWELMFGTIDDALREALAYIDLAERALMEALVAMPKSRRK
ncbi:MAG: hypothetical protein ACN6PX_03135 [Stenotrophomonas lactitubi]|uniref:hypothetical protein n=1 Tax=Stenotrophomonas lactitubi TaxID=2045214 RepID=UPI003D0D5FD0